ncbi:MAG: hypothetical protein Q4D19_00300 [Lautropia sp.]|nr:hypothetical protein [Lautropia sp.]
MSESDTLIPRAVRPSWQTLPKDLSALGPADPDFLAERPDVIEEGRSESGTS